MESSESAFDKILSLVGGDGRYQTFLLWVFLAPLHAISAMMITAQIFQSSTPDHWCYVPGKPVNMSDQDWRTMTIPLSESAGWQSCLQYASPISDLSYSTNSTSQETIDCQNGWQFDSTWYDHTIVTEHQWVCGKQLLSAQWLTAGLIGNVVGILIFNNLADRIGRKPTVMIVTQIYALFGVLRVLAGSEALSMATMFLSSVSLPATIDISFILVMEQVSGDYRSRTTFVSFLTWLLGMCVIPLLAWASRSWVTLGLMTSLPCLAHLPIQYFTSESPRWLAYKGRISEAKRVLTNMAKVNGKTVPADLEQRLIAMSCKESSSKGCSNQAAFELLAHPKIRIRTILLTLAFMANTLIYYGLLFNNENMSGNPFLNFFFFGIMEIPSCALGWSCSQWLGRRLTGSLFIALSAVSIAAAAFLLTWLPMVSVGLLITAKTLVNVSFFAVFLQIVEIYPTSHRSLGAGLTNVFVAIASVAIPYIVDSKVFWDRFPYIIFTVIGVCGTVAAQLLPETLDQNLPQTIEDVENGFDSQPIFKYQGKTHSSLTKRKSPAQG